MDYPTNFPCPTWRYGETNSKFMGRTQFECGWARQRHTWPDDRTTYQLSFKMDTTMFHDWSVWMNQNGYDWFNMELDIYSGIHETISLRLVDVISYAYDDYNTIRATCSAEKQNA